MYIKALLVVLVLSFLTSCGSVVTSGTVVAKEYKPEWVQLLPQSHKIGNATILTMLPIHHPEKYLIKLENCVEVRCLSSWKEVDKSLYDTLSIGSYVEFDR